MKLKSVVAALAFAAAAGPTIAATCQAIDDTLGTLDASETEFTAFCVGQGSFSDYYSFSLATHGGVGGTLVEWDLGSILGVDLTSVRIGGGSLGSTWLTDSTSQDSFSFANLGGGNYTLNVTGVVTGWSPVNSYGGAIHAVAAPVPEPETYAMMALGLGLLIWVTRRRQPQ